MTPVHPFQGYNASGEFDLILFAMLATDPTDANAIAPPIRDALEEYGRLEKPAIGGFLYALLSNDLQEAARRADPYNKITLVALAFYVFNRLPSECHGSEKAVDAWLARARDNLNKARAMTVDRRADFEPRRRGIRE